MGAAEIFERVQRRPPTFYYELKRPYNKPVGEVRACHLLKLKQFLAAR